MRVCAYSFVTVLVGLVSLAGCVAKTGMSETWLQPQDVPLAVKTFIVQHHQNDSVLYSIVREGDESFIEVTLPKTIPPTEYLFSLAGELIEKSVAISFENLDMEQRRAITAAVQSEFQGASISSLERVARYESGKNVDFIEITVRVPYIGTGRYELTFSLNGTLQSIREVPLAAIDTLF